MIITVFERPTGLLFHFIDATEESIDVKLLKISFNDCIYRLW